MLVRVPVDILEYRLVGPSTPRPMQQCQAGSTVLASKGTSACLHSPMAVCLMFSQSLNALMIVSYFKKLPLCDNHGRGLVSRQ